MRTGRLNDKKLMKLASTMGELGDANIYIDDQAGQHINSLRTKARRLAVESGVDIILSTTFNLCMETVKRVEFLRLEKLLRG